MAGAVPATSSTPSHLYALTLEGSTSPTFSVHVLSCASESKEVWVRICELFGASTPCDFSKSLTCTLDSFQHSEQRLEACHLVAAPLYTTNFLCARVTDGDRMGGMGENEEN